MKEKKSKAERRRDREILELYHKKVTEEALEPLYEYFEQWKNGAYPYDELTERIHEFHKENQEIYKKFNYHGGEMLVFEAKKELDMFSEKDWEKEHYHRLKVLFNMDD
ncbi:hypothetical protein [Pontibacillus yanchengensis]|uniref:Uncharacterized protein n=1 Tax=Pontibacillus yanchengensis Y32 TaxID=1385514 RepID=A0A0A2TJS9_9BACI|nr:hypothetical protein [Pontibacillus yanchengensis]KGP74698.1 hypothetical protein N782_00640 [Pontibacillus yanchengensis Y32]